MCPFGMWLFWTKAIETAGLQRNFYPSLNYLENFKLEVFPRMRIISRDKFDLSGPSVCQKKHQLPNVCSYSYCPANCPSPLWSPRILSIQVAYIHIHTHIHTHTFTSLYLSVFKSIMYVGSCTYKIKCEFLLSIYFILMSSDQPKKQRVKENFFSPTPISVSCLTCVVSEAILFNTHHLIFSPLSVQDFIRRFSDFCLIFNIL